MIKKEFVCMFIFDDQLERVLLVRKLKGPTPGNPQGQRGKLNGIGGKVEPEDDDRFAAMSREALEETGFNPFPAQHYHTETYLEDFERIIVHYFFFTSTELLEKIGQMQVLLDGSPVEVTRVDEINYQPGLSENYVWNVPYLILMAATLANRSIRNWPQKHWFPQ